ncbi:Pentraxin-4 [Manis javanica]|nr:Pentraxin-4 [Manis javanica]
MGEACVPSPAPTAATSPLQFCRFQEVTLTDLQGVVSNYNLSHSINTRFLGLASETQAMALAVNQSLATVQDHLGHLKTWMCKTQHRSQKVDSRLLALGTALSERRAQCSRDRKEQAAQRDTLSQLALGVWALQDKMAHLTHLVQSEGVRLAALKGWPQDFAEHLQGMQEPPGPGSLWAQPPKDQERTWHEFGSAGSRPPKVSMR